MAEPAPRQRLPRDLLDALHVKIGDGKVVNRPTYVALAVTV
jgi:transposase-like protein